MSDSDDDSDEDNDSTSSSSNDKETGKESKTTSTNAGAKKGTKKTPWKIGKEFNNILMGLLMKVAVLHVDKFKSQKHPKVWKKIATDFCAQGDVKSILPEKVEQDAVKRQIQAFVKHTLKFLSSGNTSKKDSDLDELTKLCLKFDEGFTGAKATKKFLKVKKEESKERKDSLEALTLGRLGAESQEKRKVAVKNLDGTYSGGEHPNKKPKPSDPTSPDLNVLLKTMIKQKVASTVSASSISTLENFQSRLVENLERHDIAFKLNEVTKDEVGALIISNNDITWTDLSSMLPSYRSANNFEGFKTELMSFPKCSDLSSLFVRRLWTFLLAEATKAETPAIPANLSSTLDASATPSTSTIAYL